MTVDRSRMIAKTHYPSELRAGDLQMRRTINHEEQRKSSKVEEARICCRESEAVPVLRIYRTPGTRLQICSARPTKAPWNTKFRCNYVCYPMSMCCTRSNLVLRVKQTPNPISSSKRTRSATKPPRYGSSKHQDEKIMSILLFFNFILIIDHRECIAMGS